MANWHFRNHDPGAIARNSDTEAFFAAEDENHPAEALIREAIQNSLGARAENQIVRMRFTLGQQISDAIAKRWLSEAWPHFQACGIDDLGTSPSVNRVLVVEDFGTGGLEGDPDDRRPSQATSGNDFYKFFLAEGISGREGIQGGRWGIGKTVFRRCSRIKTFFGLTIRRSDKKRLMMGRCILRLHAVNGQDFEPDGQFGESRPDYIDPITDSATLQRFIADFGITRVDEPGLSVAIPYAEEEITGSAILETTIREFFWPILLGRLIVEVDCPAFSGGMITLSRDTIQLEVARLGDTLTRLSSIIELALWARDESISNQITLPEQSQEWRPSWDHIALPSEVADRLIRAYIRGEPVAIRVPLWVRRESHLAQPTFFRVVLERDLDGKGGVPIFIRNDIIVPNQRARSVRKHAVRVLVIIDDETLSALLGDAEPPAHERWTTDTPKFQKAKYVYGSPILDFVRNAPKRLAEMLSNEQQQRDAISLADFFPHPPEEDGLRTRQKKRQKPGSQPEDDPDPPPSHSKAIRIDQIAGGFIITRDNLDRPRPGRIEIRVAYDRTRGSPLTKYDPSDFKLQGMRRQLPGAREVTCHENRMLVDLPQDDFRIQVTGFDENRDLVVKLRELEQADDQTT